MAIDTADKRFSMLEWGDDVGMPAPDGSFDQGDRQHLLGNYSGVLWGAGAFLTFAINGTTITGVKCEWSRDALQTTPENTRTYSDYSSHTWNLRETLIPRWLILRNLRGQQVTLITNDIDTRNTLKEYPDAILETVSGNQFGHQVRNINLTFKVRTE